MKRRDLLLAALAPGHPLNLRDVAAVHVRIAEEDRADRKLWGRIGGSAAEHRSADALAAQLKPFLPQVTLESFRFRAHRALEWGVTLGGAPLETAMPAPFEARFPEHGAPAPVVVLNPDEDWARARGKWVFVDGSVTSSTAFNLVREKLLYQRAVGHVAAGLLFALRTPSSGRWKSVVPVDKPYAVRDERYPGGIRPIPCFSVDSIDGRRVASSPGAMLAARITYDTNENHEARNVVGFLPGSGGPAVGILCHIDSFFGGACDNASGTAALVGLAERLSRLPASSRRPDLYFLGLAAHHDEAAGMRNWVSRDPARFARIRQLFLLEHVDALDSLNSNDGRAAGWPLPLNNNRTAYLGPQGWPEVRALLPELVRSTGVMTVPPKIQDACIADLFVTCGQVKGFCLMNAPPYYHTDHDTLDKISDRGIRNAVDFHWELLRSLRLIEA